jgi:ribosomal protein S18 acetylase RimI-like enzyme
MSGPRDIVIAPATSAADLSAMAALMRAYAASIGIDLGYQDFDNELASLPGKYAPPTGALLLARNAGTACGCVALRQLDDDGCCEMKRLYVTPEGRGLGLGRRLADTIVAEARRLGYREMRLDTLPTMQGAIALYRSLGFVETVPYYATPIQGTVFLRLGLG